MSLFFAKRDAWSPYHLSPSVLRGWWSAADHASTALMTDDGAGLISSWKDRINGINLTATTTARPTWTATLFNTAYPGVGFDGVNNNLLSLTVTALPTGATPGCLIGVLTAITASPSGGRYMGYGASGACRQILNATVAAVGTARISDDVAALNAASVLVGAPQIVTAEFNTSNLNGWRNGTPFPGNPTAAGPLATVATRMRFGAHISAGATNFGTCAIADCLVTTALTTQQKQQVEGWAAWTYGFVASLPVGHPFKDAPP